MTQKEIDTIKEVAKHFQFEGNLVHMEPWGNGHINDTYVLTFEIGKMGSIRVILQRINKSVFPNPEEVMENIMNITNHLHKKIFGELQCLSQMRHAMMWQKAQKIFIRVQ